MRTFPVFDKLGGLEATFEKLRSHGFPVATKDALRMWRNPQRGRIPGDATVCLMRICEQERIPYVAADFELSERAA